MQNYKLEMQNCCKSIFWNAHLDGAFT